MRNAFVILGVSGDLAKRKLLPALLEIRDKEVDCKFIGYSRSKPATDEFGNDFYRLDIELIQGDYGDLSKLFEYLTVGKFENVKFHLALPTEVFPVIISQIAKVTEFSFEIILEKPYFKSDEELIEIKKWDEITNQKIYFIDHYLGKVEYRKLLTSKVDFSEVNSIKVNLLEVLGVGGRGGFYDSVGIIWDVFHSHILQVIVSFLSVQFMLSKIEILDIIKNRFENKEFNLALFQYDSYQEDIGNINPNSKTATEMKLLFSLELENKKLNFEIHAGKKMPVTKSNIEINGLVVDLKSDKPISAYGNLYLELLNNNYSNFLSLQEVKLQYDICRLLPKDIY